MVAAAVDNVIGKVSLLTTHQPPAHHKVLNTFTSQEILQLKKKKKNEWMNGINLSSESGLFKIFAS
jgi:hypothetical protein